jgi:hypothetical protein
MPDPQNDYLWDKRGQPDPSVEQLEEFLSPLRYEPKPLVPAPEKSTSRRRWNWFLIPLAAAAAIVVLGLAINLWRLHWTTDSPWQVHALAGKPSIGATPFSGDTRLGVGETIETDANSRAEVQVARIGTIEVEPSTQLELVETQSHRHTVRLEVGKISARLWAPPFSLYTETPSASTQDLGCAYTLEVAPDGSGLMKVTTGWISVEAEGYQTLIPAGAQAESQKGHPPGAPYFDDATPQFKAALRAINFGNLDADSYTDNLLTLLHESRQQDVITLLSLLQRADSDRGALYDRIAQLDPPPPGVTKQGIINRDPGMIETWSQTLHLPGVKTWWLDWHDGLF